MPRKGKIHIADIRFGVRSYVALCGRVLPVERFEDPYECELWDSHPHLWCAPCMNGWHRREN